MNIQEKIDFIQNNFMVINKEERLVPVRLFKMQEHFIRNRKRRTAALKARQMGLSTAALFDNSVDLFKTPFQRQTIITHDSETSEFLFQNVQRFYRNLPWNVGKSEKEMNPKHDWKSGTRMRFPKIDSYIYIDSAKSDSVGAGHTITRCHLSELAKWSQRKAEQLFADISQTVPKTGHLIVESTPQGRAGLFYDIYKGAKKGTNGFTPFFYPWWWEEGYIQDVDEYMTDEKAEIVADILGQSASNYLKDEKKFKEFNKLTDAQIAFRRWKIGEIKLLFFQEYPENDEDCWLSSDLSVIPGADLRPYYSEIREGEIHGNWTVWKKPIGGRDYIIGADVATGRAKDYSCAAVIDTRSLEYVARIRGKIHTDQFAEELIRIGHEYNDAMIAVERNGHGHSVLRVLLEKNYENLYYHVDYDSTNEENADAGWVTSKKTRPMMLSTMIATFRAHDLISWSENLLTEASSLVWEGGVDINSKTTSGESDDEFMSIAIAIQVRELMPVITAKAESPNSHSYAPAIF